MKIQLFKKTKDSDLSEGQKVVYQDKAGEFNLVGTIESIYIDNDGTVLYKVAGASYMADELKLIEVKNKTINEKKEAAQYFKDLIQHGVETRENLGKTKSGELKEKYLNNCDCLTICDAVIFLDSETKIN